jgi:hypothetical protein
MAELLRFGQKGGSRTRMKLFAAGNGSRRRNGPAEAAMRERDIAMRDRDIAMRNRYVAPDEISDAGVHGLRAGEALMLPAQPCRNREIERDDHLPFRARRRGGSASGSRAGLSGKLHAVNADQPIQQRARARRRGAPGIPLEKLIAAGLALALGIAAGRSGQRVRIARRHQSPAARREPRRVRPARSEFHQWHAHGCLHPWLVRAGPSLRRENVVGRPAGSTRCWAVLLLNKPSSLSSKARRALHIPGHNLFGERYPNMDLIASGML